MFITHTNIVQYLLGKGLLDLETVVGDNISILPYSSRNRNFKIDIYNKRGLLLKQPMELDDYDIATSVAEAEFYKYVFSEDSHQETLRQFMPSFVLHDNTNRVLLIEFIKEAGDVYKLLYRQHAFPLSLAQDMATILSTLHKRFFFEAAELIHKLERKLPWAFTFLNDGFEKQGNNKANQQLIQLIKTNNHFVELVSEASKSWEENSVIHGDIKWSNFLCSPDPQKLDLKLVDWELVSVGDFCWDIAGVLQSMISFWTFAHDDQQANISFNNMERWLQDFWTTYVRQANLSNPDGALFKSMKYCAVRIIQTCYESNANPNGMSPANARLLQVAYNILKNPDRAIEAFIQIRVNEIL